jgi:hypothetical protein
VPNSGAFLIIPAHSSALGPSQPSCSTANSYAHLSTFSFFGTPYLVCEILQDVAGARARFEGSGSRRSAVTVTTSDTQRVSW